MAASTKQKGKASKTRSLASAKVAAYLKIATQSDSLWAAIIVFFGSLFLLAAVPFYPVYIVPVLAAVCGLISFRYPPAGVILGFVLIFPAVAYQSAIFGWLFFLILAIVLFEVMENWVEISALQVLILAPFAFGASPLFGWVTIFGMAVGAYYFGSQKSMMISLPSVFFILLLSAIWVTPNGAFMPLKVAEYTKYAPLQLSKAPVALGNLGGTAISSVTSLFNLGPMGQINAAMNVTISNIVKLLFADSGLIQLAGWAAVLYAISYLSGMMRDSRKQLKSSLALLIMIPVYSMATTFSGVAFRIEFVGVIIGSIALLGIMEQAGIVVSREEMLQRSARAMKFGKHGMKDVGVLSDVTLNDIGGYKDVKQELTGAIMLPLEKKGLAEAYGLKPPSGVLLFGPPGTGKTMLMKALAKEMKYAFINVKTTDILSQWYGESEKNLAEAFENARKHAPSILFFDEIDAIAKKRTEFTADDVGPRVLTTLLGEMDGAVKSKKPVIIVGTTNIPNKLDAAILRPGRFDKIIYMHLPDPDARAAIFKKHLSGIEGEADLDYALLAKKTNRFSGADIANIVKSAVKLTAREAQKAGAIVPISMENLLFVISRTKPSTSIASLDEYEQFRMDFERRVAGKEEEKPREKAVSWKDVGGLGKVKDALLEAIQLPLLHEDLMKEYNVRPSKGILLFGPPGTGKTLIVKAACNELKASFQSLSGAELMKKGYTRAVEVVRETFNRARENTPAILFVDEIETFAPARGGAGGSEIIGQFLTEMDGLKELKGVVVIAATNRPAILDPAILRPGRFDKIFYISPPDGPVREQIFRIHLGKFAKGVDLKSAAMATPGFTGADIASVCQEAKMQALRAKIAGGVPKVTTEMILRIIKTRRPSITRPLLEEYEQFLSVYGERGAGSSDEDEGAPPPPKKKKKQNRHYR